MGNILFLTESAKEQMVNMLEEHNKNAVRLALKGGGCAGFKYDWSLEDETKSDDEVIELPKGKFLIDGTFSAVTALTLGLRPIAKTLLRISSTTLPKVVPPANIALA